ncbi:hypothetical protein GQR58_030094 [Nymphon striatum]|nr:hypothetical protein GQR58_030094 [Nymphon striatum]
MHTSRHALAAHADEHGEAAGDESIDVRQQFQVVRLGFAEPDAGIDPHAVGAGVGGDCRSRNHAGKHIIDHVVVAGAVLHGIGRALHVRSNKADPELTGNRTERGAHVIDHARPGSHGGSRHHFVPGVDRDPNGVRRLVDDGLDHGDDPGQFFLDRDRGRARSGRLAADIEQPGTLGDQLATTSDRVVSARMGSGQEAHGFHAGGDVVAEDAADRGRDRLGSRLADATHGHTQVLGFDDHNGAARFEDLAHGVGALGRQSFLDLGATGVAVDQAGELGQARDATLVIRDVTHVRHAHERDQMMLTQRVDRDVSHHHHLLMTSFELGDQMRAEGPGASHHTPRHTCGPPAEGCRADRHGPGPRRSRQGSHSPQQRCVRGRLVIAPSSSPSVRLSRITVPERLESLAAL